MSREHHAVLRILFEMASEDRHADLVLIADELRLSCAEVDMLLADLEGAGLVDAERVRLTMTGLVLAVSKKGQRRRRAPGLAACPSSSRAA